MLHQTPEKWNYTQVIPPLQLQQLCNYYYYYQLLLNSSYTHHKCRIGVVACRTASKAPPLSRNHTLCSSSKIYIEKHICSTRDSTLSIWRHNLLKVCSLYTHTGLTCLQLFPASDVINIPRLLEDSSVPIFPEYKNMNNFTQCVFT